MSKIQTAIAKAKETRPTGYFEFQQTNAAGYPIGPPVRVNTVTGITLQVHPLCDTRQVRHICDMARENPDAPYDLSAWRNTREGKQLEWSARIYYRSY